jgi:hypothetical protein
MTERLVGRGSVNFFGHIAFPGAGHAAHQSTSFAVGFDAARALADISDQGTSPVREVTIVFEPAAGVTGDTPESLDQRFNHTSQPSIGRIVLQLYAGPSR